MNEEHRKALLDHVASIERSMLTLEIELSHLKAMIPKPGWRLRAHDEMAAPNDWIYVDTTRQWYKLTGEMPVGKCIIKTLE